MSVTQQTLKANQEYAARFSLGHLPMPPSRHLAVLACMDARLSVEQFLGLKTGEAHVIRNAGGIVTEDALRSLVISLHLLGTNEIMIINHTDCGMLTFKDQDLLEKLHRSTGASPVAPASFLAFSNIEENVRRQIDRLRRHPWIPKDVPIRGFIYDVKTGRLSEVAPEPMRKPNAA